MSDLFQHAIDYLDAGLRLIPLHPIVGNKCGCEKEIGHPCKAIGKHPLRSNWLHQPLIDPATLDIWQDNYQCSGLGWALDHDHIVLDVDARSGGLESLEKLQSDIGIDLFAHCSCIVKTGGGGFHFYYKKPAGSLGWKLHGYAGIDIRQGGGFVVVAGSMHASGSEYEFLSFEKSQLDALELLPDAIASLLVRQVESIGGSSGSHGDVSIAEIHEMLSYIRNEDHDDYESWLRIGMAVHHASGGSHDGMQAWDTWSRNSAKYDASAIEQKWHSFGKRGTGNTTMGTLVHLAKEAGWEPQGVGFMSKEEIEEVKRKWAKVEVSREAVKSIPSIIDDADLDLFAPTGILGKVFNYVFDCSVYPNRSLALACALSVVSNIAGRRYYWPGRFSNITPNLIVLCVAGSSVGKDSVLSAAFRLLKTAGIAGAMHGRIKSEKDLLDALEANQFAMYYIDEFGGFLRRVNNASKTGGASYLEGVIYTIMETFTKSDKVMQLDVSRKKEILDKWAAYVARYEKLVEEGGGSARELDQAKKKLPRAKDLLQIFQDGYVNPMLSIFTMATPSTMELAFSGEATENGFLSRAITFHEFETNPLPKSDFRGAPEIDLGLSMALKSASWGSVKDECPFNRLDSYKMERQALVVDPAADEFLGRIHSYFLELAEANKQHGLESLPRRALESVVKIAITMSCDTGHVTLDIVRYAAKMVRREMEQKIRKVLSTEGMQSKDVDSKMEGLCQRIAEICDTDKGERASVILHRVKKSGANKEMVDAALDHMVKAGHLVKIEGEGREVDRFRFTGKL